MNESEVKQVAADEEIKDYNSFKRALNKSDYRQIKRFKDAEPTIYEDFNTRLKQEQDEARGIIKF